jgi:hypothetical protein
MQPDASPQGDERNEVFSFVHCMLTFICNSFIKCNTHLSPHSLHKRVNDNAEDIGAECHHGTPPSAKECNLQHAAWQVQRLQ